jgi:hypothetical protein
VRASTLSSKSGAGKQERSPFLLRVRAGLERLPANSKEEQDFGLTGFELRLIEREGLLRFERPGAGTYGGDLLHYDRQQQAFVLRNQWHRKSGRKANERQLFLSGRDRELSWADYHPSLVVAPVDFQFAEWIDTYPLAYYVYHCPKSDLWMVIDWRTDVGESQRPTREEAIVTFYGDRGLVVGIADIPPQANLNIRRWEK